MKRNFITFMAILFCVAASLPLSAQNSKSNLATKAENHLKDYAKNYQLSLTDVHDYIITDEYTSGGITHIYFRQAYKGIEVYGANAAVHIANDKVISSNNQFIPALETRIRNTSPKLTAIDAIKSLAKEKNYETKSNFRILENREKNNTSLLISKGDISRNDIPARLVYMPDAKGDIHLAWDVAINETQGMDYMSYRVDTSSGEILDEISWTVHCNFGEGAHSDDVCEEDHSSHSHTFTPSNLTAVSAVVNNSYNVFAWPVESPNFGSRSIQVNPEADNTTASPNGWHSTGNNSYTTTRGNNVDAYIDNDDSNSPTGGDAARAEGGTNLEFDFNWTVGGDQTTYKDAAVTNLFYWNNITHDVWYNYGFDEASGNFQENNFGNGGSGSDFVQAQAQDGSGTCNANFSTPPDGNNPTMQMYLCNGRDGDYDNGVVVHEYGHGISIRLTGGPSTSGCLSGDEQMGEGWSDYFGNMMTIEAGDTGPDARPMGTWLFGQGPNGGGIRPFPYSTDMSVNPMTYSTIGSGVSIPHGVGSVWATMLWDMTWAMIDEYGLDLDIYNGNGGNNMAMRLVIEGLKLQPCAPGFVDGRDAILAADQAIYGGANQCLIWEAFANRGLGFSANQGSSGSATDGTEAFDMPPACSIGLEKTSNVNQVAPGENITYTLTATNNTAATLTNVVISDDLPTNTTHVSGGSLSGNTVSFPSVSLGVNQSHSVSFTVQVSGAVNPTVADFSDNMEGGAGNWNATVSGPGGWNIQSGTSSSGSNAWFASDQDTPSQANLTIATTIGLSGSSTMSFNHSYNTEATWDGGVVEISTNGGTSWANLGSNMTSNGYNSTINNSSASPAFSGNSNGFITTQIDLSAYDGQNVLIRFRMSCDQSVGGEGWYVDDVMIGGLVVYIPNTAQVTDGNLVSSTTLATPTLVIGGNGTIPVSVSATSTSLSCNEGNNGTATATAINGTETYSYSWSNGGSGATITGLSAGIYSVTVNDGETIATSNVTVTEPTAVTGTTTATNANGGNNGAVDLTPTGGTAPYSYAWNNGATTQDITGLASGTYTVVITDANDCTGEASVTVGDDTPAPCLDNEVTLSITLDNYPEETAWSLTNENGITVANGGLYPNEPDGSTLNFPLCLTDGCYDFTITDTYGDGICCQWGTGSYSITENATGTILASGGEFTSTETMNFCVGTTTTDPLSASITSLENPSCNGGNNGVATATATEGTGTYSYTWSTGATTATVTGLSAGTYTVDITDGNETVTLTVNIEEPTAIVVSTTSTNTSCGENNGSATASGQGGTGGLTYSWNNGATSAAITGLGAGTYTVTAMDINGCTSTSNVVVEESSTASVSASSTDTSCGENNGTATATGAVAYQWSNGANGASISDLPAGTYTVEGTDANGCTASATVVVGASNSLSVTANATNSTCGNQNGSATAMASSTSTYAWSNGMTTQTISGLAAGTYTVTATSTEGCTATATGVVEENSNIEISATATNTTCGENNGSATAIGAISYQWSNGMTGATITGLAPGNYVVTGTDANNCTATTEVLVEASSSVTLNIATTNANSGNNGSADLTVLGGNPPYSYAWSNGATSEDVNGLAPDTYEVIVTDANGCIAFEVITIGDDTPPPSECEENEVTLTLNLDNYPEETEWALLDANENTIANGGPYGDLPDGTTVTEDFCLEDGCYSFVIYDSFGDGICCGYGNGSYQLTDADNNVLLSGGEFGANEITQICVGEIVPTCNDGLQNGDEEGIDCGGSNCEPCNTDCSETTINFNNFDSSWGIWNDGGSDCRRSTNDANYAYSGNRPVRLRDNTSTSTTTTDLLDLSSFEELTVDFTYITNSMENGEDFWVQISTDGGSTYTTVASYARGAEFENGTRYFEAITVAGPFSSNTRVRFRCDASGNRDYVYIDDVLLTGCANSNFNDDIIIGKEQVVEYRNDDISHEMEITEEGISAIRLFPNPTSGDLTVSYEIGNATTVQLIVTDLSGKRISIQENRMEAGIQTTRLNVSDFNAGIYLLQLVTEDSREMKKFVVVK